jgi:hypothetical protein
MSTPISAMMHSAARLPTPVMVSSRSLALAKGAITWSTRWSSWAMAASRCPLVVKRQPDQQPMMLAEAAPQGLAQLGELLAQLALGQLGKDLGVAFAGDQGLEDRPARHAQHVSGDRDPA